MDSVQYAPHHTDAQTKKEADLWIYPEIVS